MQYIPGNPLGNFLMYRNNRCTIKRINDCCKLSYNFEILKGYSIFLITLYSVLNIL